MRTKQLFISSVIFLSMMLILSSCFPKVNNSYIASLSAKTNIPLTDDASSLTTPTIYFQQTVGEIDNKILTKNQNCDSCCFYGIEPNITTITTAENIFSSLGSPLRITYKTEQQKYYYTSFQNDDSLYITVVLKTEADIVQNINVTASPNEINKNISDQVFLYFKNLFSIFGQPDDIRISINYPNEPTETENEFGYSLYLFYANEDLIIEYDYRVATEKNQILLCPLTNEFQGAWLWLGKNPDYAPLVETKLENVSALTIQQFYNMYNISNPEISCFLVSP